MDNESAQYACLVTKVDKFEVPPVAEVLAREKKLLIADAALAARRCWGFAADNVEKSVSDRLAMALNSAGIGGVSIPVSLVEPLSPVTPVNKIEFLEGALNLWAKTGESLRVTSQALTLVAAVCYRQTTKKEVKVQEGPDLKQQAVRMGIFMTTGIPLGLGRKPKEVVKVTESSDLVYGLDLCQKEGAMRLRILAEDFDYSCLKGKMTYNTIENFRSLIEAITHSSPLALRNRGTRVLIERRPINNMGYDTIEDMERESRWLLTLRELKLI
jgi:hypothetical protein